MVPKDYNSSKLFLYIFSDSYIGLDQQYIIDIDKINCFVIRKYNLVEKKFEVVNQNKDFLLQNIKEQFEDRDYLKNDEDKNDVESKMDDVESSREYSDDDLIFDNWL